MTELIDRDCHRQSCVLDEGSGCTAKPLSEDVRIRVERLKRECRR
jgi:hypothetical protein